MPISSYTEETYTNLIESHTKRIKELVALRRKLFLSKKGLRLEDLPLYRDARSFEHSPERYKLTYDEADAFYHWESDAWSDVPHGYRIENIDDLLPSDVPGFFNELAGDWRSHCWNSRS